MSAAWSRFVFIAGVALAASPGSSAAQELEAPASRGLLSRAGEYVLVGGGVTGFSEGDLEDRFDVGGSWDVRLGVGSRFYVGGEVAYVGSVRAADGTGSDLLSNGAEAVLRLQYPYERGPWLVEPFLFGGVGWSRLALRDAAPGVRDHDDVGVVPFGAGITLGHDRLLLDARFTYRTSFGEDLALTASDEPADLQQWGVTAAIGYEF